MLGARWTAATPTALWDTANPGGPLSFGGVPLVREV